MNKFCKNGIDYTLIRQQAVELFKSGLNRGQIAKELHTDPHATGRWLREVGCIYSKVNKANINSNIFNNIDTEEKAYWLGFLFANGYVSSLSAFELSIGLKDLAHLEKFKIFLSFEGNIHIDNKIGRCRLQFTDKQIVNDLKYMGCVNKKSLILEFPEKLSEELYSHFIRGYFDGDGCINHPKESLSVSIIGTFSFIKTIHEILDLPISNIKHRDSKHSDKVFTNLLSGNNARKVCNYMYDNASIYLERKYIRFLDHEKSLNWCKLVKILDLTDNGIHTFNNCKLACQYMNCTFDTIKRHIGDNVVIKKKYKILEYGKKSKR